ncbi:rCG50685 [Rattus norvegicus]|uniref:RCG50685 n=1 Tax=Rattus norvegicus TaxID=10116 RepID=A6KC14_RAT|nr:rCG50685 [Rattus norvegicus]
MTHRRINILKQQSLSQLILTLLFLAYFCRYVYLSVLFWSTSPPLVSWRISCARFFSQNHYFCLAVPPPLPAQPLASDLYYIQ